MEWALANSGRILALAGQHLVLAVLPLVLGLVISLPLAQAVRGRQGLRAALLTVSSVLYTVPSLALFIILPVVLGTRILDPVNVVVALTVYAVALLVRSALDALDSVDGELSLAATAMGHTPATRYFLVDLPLSLPVLIAGLRAVSVSNISLVSVAALVGMPNLGILFTEGLQRGFITEILVGLVGILVLALLMDLALVLAGRALAPWARHVDGAGRRKAARA
ncbi:glycine/betaine ABC transporter permease [Sinomonas cellulolyticus]|uniref:ABC transporter permease subunit n=1 Tax=Sinomonas cellulolyticus TaxID=2801916 RepID=A0ABS1JZC9_9MICC|nr:MULTISPECIES: ABC transporter permease subunit [Sinomonas]MBL0704766.1 ABC transporter permease subunit [Sinomonas cellulolyticus]GHG46926.1 glycine/betaine ABC transporter permease [Sinomonas sp. KCTC 49339]